MEQIDYSWSEKNSENIEDIIIDTSSDQTETGTTKLSTRNNLQIMRRLFHMGNGIALATLYLISFSHEQMIHFIGTIACGIYIVEQIRINYPETASKFIPITRFIIRAEEQLKESAMVPYAIALLLTIITFPKNIALVGIYTLALADPLSALVGIKFGTIKIGENRTLQGSMAFFFSTFFSALFVLLSFTEYSFGLLVFASCFLLALATTLFDMINIKIDDNITIPLFTSFAFWLICETLGLVI